MHSTAILFILGLIVVSPGRATPQGVGDGDREDTTRIYPMEEVVIPAGRYPFSAAAAGAIVYSVDSSLIVEDPSKNIGDLVEKMRGVHLLRYGGGASLQTISIRGLGSENTSILVNGMPAGNGQSGVSDVGLIPAAGLGRVEISPGGATALFGSGATGGVVNLVPRMPRRGDSPGEAGAGLGSFGRISKNARVTVMFDSGSGVALSGMSVSGRGDYPIPLDGGVMGRIPNNDHRMESLALASTYPVDESVRTEMFLNVTQAEQGSPGPTTGNGLYSAARRTDRRMYAGCWVSSEEGAVSWNVGAAYDDQFERYSVPGEDGPTDDHYRVKNVAFSGTVRYRLPADAMLLAGSDLSWTVSDANTGTGRKSRGMGAGFISMPLWWLLSAGDGVHIGLTPSVRYESLTVGEGHLSWKIGLNALGGNGAGPGRPDFRLHASAGNGRRMPGFNDLYYDSEWGRGNPLLRAEYSHGYDAGVGGNLGLPGIVSWDVTYYRVALTDRIVWLPTSNPWIWSPQNIGSAISEGWEVWMKCEVLQGCVSIDLNYSNMNSTYRAVSDGMAGSYDKHIMYIPLNKGSVELVWIEKLPLTWLGNVLIGSDLMYTGPRFTTEDNSSHLPSIFLLSTRIRVGFSVGGTTGLIGYSGTNLTGRSYEVVPGYPMPGFSHSVEFAVKIGN